MIRNGFAALTKEYSMNVLFICKASTKIGLGHLIRSRTLATDFKLSHPNTQVEFVLIGDGNLGKLLLSVPFVTRIIDSENELRTDKKYDVIFFDLMHIDSEVFFRVKDIARITVSLSPICNMLKCVDILFNRTKYLPLESDRPKEIFAGLEYSIIQGNCEKIGAGTFEENLKSHTFPIAISMGGGDAANRTLSLLKTIKNCSVPATFWVLLGEGYQHSYNDLINEIKINTTQEIILAKTNRSMWHILKNCLLFILPGGITTYESVFAGLPSINFLEEDNNYFLIRELVENKVSYYGGIFNDENLNALNKKIESLYSNRNELMEMHVKSKHLIARDAAARIYDVLNAKLETSL